jgi:glutathione S-transferase
LQIEGEGGEASVESVYDSRVICEYLQSVASEEGAAAGVFPSGAARWVALRRQALADGMQDAMVSSRLPAHVLIQIHTHIDCSLVAFCTWVLTTTIMYPLGSNHYQVLLRYEEGMRSEEQRCKEWVSAQEAKVDRAMQALDYECSAISEGAVDIG